MDIMDEERHLDLPSLERDRGLVKKHASEIKPKELRILLIGKTGDGKSATANTILGRKKFESKLSAKSITQKCQFEAVERDGRKLVVVDTPGLCDTTFPPEVIKTELIRSVGYASPGFHAIIFVLAAGKYTKECVEVRDQFFDWFGEDVREHSLILITRGDEIEVGERKAYLQNVPKEFDKFMESCGRRVMFFNNSAKGPESEPQIKELIEEIDKIVVANQGRYFRNISFKLASAYERIIAIPAYQWVLEAFQARYTSEQTNKKTDQLQGSNDANHTTPMNVRYDEVLASSSASIDESEELLEEKIESILEKQANSYETEEPPEDMADKNIAEGMKLREQMKKNGVFNGFIYFFTRTYDKFVQLFLSKPKWITYRKN